MNSQWSLKYARMRLAVVEAGLVADETFTRWLVELFDKHFVTLLSRDEDIDPGLVRLDNLRLLLSARSDCRDSPASLLDLRVMATLDEVKYDAPTVKEVPI
jgi:hypothetical protein